MVLKLLPVAMTPLSHNKIQIWGDNGKEVSVRDLIIAGVYSVLAVGAVFGLLGINNLTDDQARTPPACSHMPRTYNLTS